MLLHELIDTAARRWPERTAVSTRTDALTHAELAAASRRVAAWLHNQGLRRGQRVVVVESTDVVVAVVITAVSRVGAVFSVLHQDTRGSALTHVLDDAEPSLLVAADDDAQRCAEKRGLPVVSPGQLRGVVSTPTDGAKLGQVLTVDPICLIYTSGTTDRPKAVVTTHQQMLFAVDAIQSRLNYQPDDVVYCPLPLSFDYGMYQLFLAAASGAHVYLGQPAEVGPGLLGNIVRSGATVLAAVPAVADTLARLLRRGPAHLPQLRLLTNTGAAMSPETLRALRAALPGLRVQLMFGLTECKRAAIMPPDGDLDRPGASGLALPGTEVFAVDAEGARLGPRQIGQLVVRGPNVMAGYWRRLELTAQRFHRRDGLFPELCTGDHGWLDEDGYVYFVGRLDDIYKERGFRVSVTEVEAAARRVPEVELAAVVPPLDGEPSALAVVTDLTPDEVLLRIREEIEEFKVPRRCVVVDRLPLNGNGKVDRKALQLAVTGD